jgi:hypothetical protein
VRDEGVYAAHALRAVTEITAGSRNGLFTSWAASYRLSVQLSDRETQFECAGGHDTVRRQGWGDSAFRLPKGNACLRTSGSTCPSTPRSATHTPRAKQRISDPGAALRLTGRECRLISTAEAAMQALALQQECRHRSSRCPSRSFVAGAKAGRVSPAVRRGRRGKYRRFRTRPVNDHGRSIPLPGPQLIGRPV